MPEQGERRLCLCPASLLGRNEWCPHTHASISTLLQINYGGDIPQHYYVRDQLAQQYEHTAVVSRGSSHQLEYEILFPGCVLR